MQPTPLLAPKQDQRLVKRRLSSISTVFSFLLQIFRRINADFTAFHTPNTTRATFSFETSVIRSQNSAIRRFLPYFLSCWRYFYVQTLILLNFTRRIQLTPLLATKQDQRLVKRRLSSILTVFSFLLEIFRRLNSVFTASHTPNTTHATFSNDTSPASR
jgi:hypothetical protein